MADRANGRADERAAQRVGHARSVEDARREVAATRRQISRDLELIEARLHASAHDLRGRVELLDPARERIRARIWSSLALAFGAGLAYALLTAKERGSRGRLAGIVHAAAAQVPGALLKGVRAGVAERLRQDLNGRRALPPGG